MNERATPIRALIVFAGLAGLALVSCNRTEPPTPDRWAPPLTSAAPVTRPGPSPLGELCDPARRRPPPHPTLLGPPPALTARPVAGLPGAPEPSARPLPSFTEQCGKGERVSVLVFAGGGPPPTPVSAVKRSALSGEALVYLDAPRLWIDAECTICRSEGRQLWIGDLSLMSDAQLVNFQRLSGLPDKPLLADPAAWRKALAT